MISEQGPARPPHADDTPTEIMQAIGKLSIAFRDQWIAPGGTTGWDNCDYSKHVTVMTCHAGFIPPGATKPVTFTEVWNKTK